MNNEENNPIGKKSNQIRRHIIYTSFFFVILVLCCYASYRMGFSAGIAGAPACADSTQTQVAAPSADSTATNVPVPDDNITESDLPFNPSGCPYIYVQGSDRETMSAGKTLTTTIYGREYEFRLGDNHPNSIMARVITEGYAVDLISELISRDLFDSSYYSDYDSLSENCSMQLTAMDVDGDGECELMLTIANKGDIMMKTFVFKLLPHPYRYNIAQYLGEIPGQLEMYVRDHRVVTPYGSQGLFEEYILAPNNKVVKI